MVFYLNIIAIAIVVIAWIIKIIEWIKERRRIAKLNEPVRTNFVFTWNDIWDFPEKEVIVEKEVEVVKEVEVEKKVKVRSMMSPFKVGIFRLFNYDDHTWILFINDWAVGAATFVDSGRIALDWFKVITQSTEKDDRDIGSILRKNDLDQNSGTLFLDNHLHFMEELLSKDLEFFRERYRKEYGEQVVRYVNGWTIYPDRMESNINSSLTTSSLIRKLNLS